MTDKEKIRAEIERRIEELQPCNTRENLRAHGAIAGYYQILSFINSMQEEPVSEDLGDYINELSKQFPEVSFAKLSRIAVRVSRWQRNQDVKNKLPKVISRTDLDEYAYQCAYDMSNDWMIENPTWHDVENACKLGARWQEKQDQSTIELAEDHAMLAGMEKMKEQMMAKAIDAQCFGFQGAALFSFRLPADNYLIGSEVKVIVINKD